MSNTYKPRQRTVAATILTSAGWMTCKMHVLEKAHLLEQLESVSEFYKVTDASLVGIDTTVEFLALQRDSVELVVPQNEPEDLLAGPVHQSQSQRVFILFGNGVIRGTLEWRENVRLSDFVTRQDGFILLRDCQVEMGNLIAGNQQVEKAPAVFVNVNHIVGISETPPA
jgi:hypothetical protein